MMRRTVRHSARGGQYPNSDPVMLGCIRTLPERRVDAAALQNGPSAARSDASIDQKLGGRFESRYEERLIWRDAASRSF